MSNDNTYTELFPYDKPRDCQVEAIDFAVEQFNSGKKIVIIEAGTGVGKSAIGLTVARKLNQTLDNVEEFEPGSYFLTTQKILQDQYISDFGKRKGCMTSIKSASNYSCSFNRSSTCAESLRALRVAEKGSPFWKRCTFNCNYRNAKTEFLEAKEGVTNFPYFLAETQYSGKIKPRNVLVIDEAHNAAGELSKFVEITMTERFAKSMLKLEMPALNTQLQAITWVKETYSPKLNSYVKHMESMLEKYTGLKDKLKEFATIAKQYDLLDKHMCKVNRFLEVYDKENWVFNVTPPDGRKGRKLEFKPIDVAPYAEEMLFNMGRKVVMMSATILDVSATCELLGLKREDVGFISIPSPFPVENRPVISASIGKMSASQIENTLPKLAEAVKAILEQHKGEKGIIHCHTFKIANYLKRNIRSSRLLVHNSDDRDKVLKEHIKSKKATVLLSPSMTEGVDLHGDNSRFQVICKVPYPYLGDKLIKKKMNKWRWWYPLQTAKTIVQAVGRSVRSDEDHAVTYILDSDWSYFFSRNKEFFPKGFKDAIK